MTNILLEHADILTLDPEGRVLRDATLAIADGLIAAVDGAAPDFAADERVDCSGQIVMPGFFNAHTHAAMSLLRGWGTDLSLEGWLADCVRPAEANLTAEDVYWGASLAAVEMVRAGIVGFADHYFFMDRVAQVVADCGLRANLAWCTFGAVTGEIGRDLAGIAAFTSEWHGAAGGRIVTSLGPHSAVLCSPQFLARSAAVAARLGVGIHTHLAETQTQAAALLARTDLTPVELLSRNGVFDVPTLCVHGLFLTEPDREILARANATVVQCPATHMRFGLGVTPVPELLAAGAHVALGTDGAGTCGALDMLTAGRQAVYLQRTTRLDPHVLPGDQGLRLATQAGARAIGFPLAGELSPGRPADLIIFDATAAHLRPLRDPLATILYAAQSSDICHVMVNGRWLLRDRALTTLDEERILAEASQRGLQLTAAAQSGVR